MNLADLQEQIYLADDHDFGLHDRVPVPHCHFCQLTAHHLAHYPPEPSPDSMSFATIVRHALDSALGQIAPEETRLSVVLGSIRWFLSATCCTLFGHTYDDPDSAYADAESGYEEITCSRCHHSFSCYH